MVSALKQHQVKTGRPTRKDATPRLPHERDESDDSQESGVREDMQQAYEDIKRGLLDTDLRGMRGVEEVNKAPTKKPAKRAKK